MSALARAFAAIFLLALFVGVVAVAAATDTSQGATLISEIPGQIQLAFASGAWWWLSRATVLVTGIAVCFTIAETLLGIRRVGGGREFEKLETGNVQEAILEVRRRIASVTDKAPDVVVGFTELMRGAVKVAASDVHVSPTAEGVKLTYRVHGALHEVAILDSTVLPPLVTRVKVLARLDTYVQGKPQDGRLVMSLDGGSIECRVSTLPTEMGERVVLRLVRGGRTVPDVESLGFF